MKVLIYARQDIFEKGKKNSRLLARLLANMPTEKSPTLGKMPRGKIVCAFKESVEIFCIMFSDLYKEESVTIICIESYLGEKISVSQFSLEH